MSNIKLSSEQPSASKSSSRGISISNKNTGESASTLAAVMLNENSNSAAAEEEKAITTATGTSSSYSSPPQPPPPPHQQQEPSVNISLSDITEMLDPFSGTTTTLPSAQRQQQHWQKGRPHFERITDVVAAEGPTNRVSTEEEAPCSPVEHTPCPTSGDEKKEKRMTFKGWKNLWKPQAIRGWRRFGRWNWRGAEWSLRSS